jgi:hypothetical protein
VAPLLRCSIEPRLDGGLGNRFGAVLGQAEAAVEIPELRAFGHGAAAFTLQVLADFVFDGVEYAVGVAAFDGERESFAHHPW